MKISFSKKQYTIFASAVLFLLGLSLICVRIFSVHYSNVFFYSNEFSKNLGRVISLNGISKRNEVSKSKYVFYKFTDNQIAALNKIYKDSSPSSLTVRLGIKNAKGKRYEKLFASGQPFYYGFIYADDLEPSGKFSGSVKKSVSAGTDLRNFIQKKSGEHIIDLSLAIKKDMEVKNLPKGFFVSAASPVRIYAIDAGSARVGFDLNLIIPFYGLASNGGNFTARPVSIDFAGCSSVFPAANSKYSVMPQIQISFFESTNNHGTQTSPIAVKINAGGEVFSRLQTPTSLKTILQTSLLKAPFNYFSLENNAELVSSIIMESNAPELITHDGVKTIFPLKTDIELILGGKRDNWRCADYELYEWDRFPHILFLDFRNYKVQSDFFLRLSFFTEKAGFRGKILSDEELLDKHSYNAHDYSADSLARFFTSAKKQNFPLNEKELLFREILIANSIIIPDGEFYAAGNGAVVSIAQESQRWLRRSFLAHEIWHSVFFTDEAFRNAVSAVYYTIDSQSLAFIQGFWKSQPSLGYNINDDYLMKNEFMAYLMQQPISKTASYFLQIAGRASVMAAQPELCSYVKHTEGKTFEDAARVLDSYAHDNWGLAAGRVSLIVRD